MNALLLSSNSSRSTVEFSPDHPPSPLNSAEWANAVRVLGLSPQQAKIVELILRGRKDKEIAATLGLSYSTVRTYIDRTFARLNVSDRVQLILRVFDSRTKGGTGTAGVRKIADSRITDSFGR